MIDVIVEAANEHVSVVPLNIADFGGGGGAGRHPVAGHFVPAAQDRTGRAAKVIVEAAAEAPREHGRGGLSGSGDEGGAAGRQLPAGDRVKAAPVEARVVEDVLVDEVVEASRDHEEGERVAAVVPEGGTGGAGREPPAGNHAPAGPTRVTVGLRAVVLDAADGVLHEHVQEAAEIRDGGSARRLPPAGDQAPAGPGITLCVVAVVRNAVIVVPHEHGEVVSLVVLVRGDGGSARSPSPTGDLAPAAPDLRTARGIETVEVAAAFGAAHEEIQAPAAPGADRGGGVDRGPKAGDRRPDAPGLRGESATECRKGRHRGRRQHLGKFPTTQAVHCSHLFAATPEGALRDDGSQQTTWRWQGRLASTGREGGPAVEPPAQSRHSGVATE